MNILASDSDENKSITEISQKIRLGKSSVSRHLNVLWNLKLIDRIHTDTINGYEIFKWKANNHNILTKKIINELKSQDVVVETTQDEVL